MASGHHGGDDHGCARGRVTSVSHDASDQQQDQIMERDMDNTPAFQRRITAVNCSFCSSPELAKRDSKLLTRDILHETLDTDWPGWVSRLYLFLIVDLLDSLTLMVVVYLRYVSASGIKINIVGAVGGQRSSFIYKHCSESLRTPWSKSTVNYSSVKYV